MYIQRTNTIDRKWYRPTDEELFEDNKVKMDQI